MTRARAAIPAYGLYGESGDFPDILHCERIADRAVRHGWTIRPHRHANLHQFFLVEGPGAVAEIDGFRRRIDRPTMISVPRYVVHGFSFARGQAGYVLSVPPQTVPDLFERSDAFARPVDVPAPEHAPDAFEAILSELADTRPLRDAMLRARVTELAVDLLRRGDGAAPRGPSGPSERHMRAFERLVRRHLREHLRITDYAARMGLGADHLGRICREMTGLTASGFVEARLMQEARRQLAYTRNPVSAIAYDLGFGDPAYFSRAFRRTQGVSPGVYRRGRASSS